MNCLTFRKDARHIMNIIYTVCNRISLPHAIALAESVSQHQPDDHFILGWVDTAPVPEIHTGCKAISINELQISSWNEMAASYYDFELVAACRPWFAKHIFATHADCNRLTFLAPTVMLLQPIEEIIAADHDIILTPHIEKALPKTSSLLDRRILNIGMFHSNSWTMRRCDQTLEFLNWWTVRTIDRAKYDLCNGMCMDQLWLNYAPVRIFNWAKAKGKGWHYGLHSLPYGPLRLENGQYTIGDNPLYTVDFAGLLLFDPIWTDYSSLSAHGQIFKNLLKVYKKKISSIESQSGMSGNAGYGLSPEISSLRTVRNNWATRLKKVTTFIDQFQI